jgi:DNA-binding FadR family transcriptional regulator
LRLIESEVARLGGEARITLSRFGVTRTALRAIGQLTTLGFIKVGTGARSANVFVLDDAWRALDADQVARRRALPRPRRARWGRLDHSTFV